jgi:hydroxypyruvate reductase
MPAPTIDQAVDHLRLLLGAAQESADAGKAVARDWPASLSGLASRSVRLLAIGKASLEMAAAALPRLGPALDAGIVTAVPERLHAAGTLDPRLTAYACDHPFPTERNLSAARTVRRFVESCRPEQTLVALLSGGGSAHLTLPAGALTLDDLAAVNRALQHAGASIHELNAVRKHTELLKGGRLAALCPAGRIESLVISDVINDDLSVIASGPTAWDPSTYADAQGVLRARGCEAAAPAVTRHLAAGLAGLHPETPKQGEPRFHTVWNRIIAGNRQVVSAVYAQAARLGYRAAIGPIPAILGDAQENGRRWIESVVFTARRSTEASGPAPMAFIAGGEPTVTVTADAGIGGPSQTVALAAASALASHPDVAVLAYSTDGIDGNSDAAGALLPPGASQRLRAAGVDPELFLHRRDATPCLEAIGAALRTGPTGTNLNHVFAALVYPPGVSPPAR